MTFDDSQTRTHKTEAAYIKEANFLIARARESYKSHDIDYLQIALFVRDMVKEERLSYSTWRHYKASIVHYFQVVGTIEALEAMDWIKSVKRQEVGCRNFTGRTSGKKQKALTQDDLYAITNELSRRYSSYAQHLSDWMVAGLATGMRPVEWWNCEYIQDSNGELALYVKNAKNTNGRSHGEYRTITIANASGIELAAIRRMLDAAAIYSFQQLYTPCKRLLHGVCRKVFPRRVRYPTLYSGRHQMVADAKASGAHPQEIAAVFGHATTLTHQEHYGKKAKGVVRPGFRAEESEASRVRVVGEEWVPPAKDDLKSKK